MTTITLSLPDELAERLRERAEQTGQDVNEYAVAAIAAGIAAAHEEEEYVPDAWDAETIAALQEGLASARAGQTVSLEELRAHTDTILKEHFGTDKRTPSAAGQQPGKS